MLLVVSWNEWSEQSALEPSDRYGVGYLQALRRVLRRHGQYRYEGEAGLWRRPAAAPPIGQAQLTECASGMAFKRDPGWPDFNASLLDDARRRV